MNLENTQGERKRKTLYISGPITGVEDYLIKFCTAENFLMLKIASGELNYTGTINPALTNRTLPIDFGHQDYMAVCFTMMDLCDGIYLLDGWRNSAGATQEWIYAKNRGMEILYEKTSEECVSLDC